MPEARTPANEPAHDVLAAEEFGVPAPDPRLNHGPVVLPADPTGIEGPHDVLAAEEFAMPAPTSRSATAVMHREDRRPLVAGLLLAAVCLAWAARRRL